MKTIIDILEQVKGEVKKRDRESAKRAIELLAEKTKEMKFELGRTYFVPEWSWNPISDGIFVYDETIRDVNDLGITKAYCTCTNYRTYFAWDLFDNKSDCQAMCDFKNSFGYDWEMAMEEFLNSVHARNEMGLWE